MARDNEERKFSWKEILFGIVSVGGAVGIGIGVNCWFQNRKLMKIFNKAASEVGELTTVEVREAIVEQAVHQAAGREVSRIVAKATRSAESEIANAAQKKVGQAVNDCYKKISSAVTDRIASESAKINMDKLSEEVVEKAKDLIAEKFDSKLDDLTEAYSKQIKSIGKVYESFAEKLGGDKGKSINLNL